ncbi:hypothetical protein CEW46_27535 [Bacillus cereus]|nr:hypothetical protein CEW46_27535 [Bacillus cereus]
MQILIRGAIVMTITIDKLIDREVQFEDWNGSLITDTIKSISTTEGITRIITKKGFIRKLDSVQLPKPLNEVFEIKLSEENYEYLIESTSSDVVKYLIKGEKYNVSVELSLRKDSYFDHKLHTIHLGRDTRQLGNYHTRKHIEGVMNYIGQFI